MSSSSDNNKTTTNILRDKLEIDTVSLFADIYNSIGDTLGDSLDKLEIVVKRMYDEYCRMKHIDEQQQAYERTLIKKSIDSILADTMNVVATGVDQSEIYAERSTFLLDESYDVDAVRNLYMSLLQESSSDNKNNTTTTTTIAAATVNNEITDQQRLNRELVELGRQVELEKLKYEQLKRDDIRMTKDLKTFEQYAPHFNYIEEIQQEDDVAELGDFTKRVVGHGSDLLQQLQESVKQEHNKVAMSHYTMTNSAFSNLMDTTEDIPDNRLRELVNKISEQS
jgi:predicted Zn-dependent protease